MSKYICVAVVLMVLVTGCKHKDSDKFNQEAMLTNIGNNIIVPAHQQFSTAAGILKQEKDAFISNPSIATLDALKLAFLSAYENYMSVETFSFNASGYIRNLNAFATDTAQINSNIASGSYNLDAAINIRAKGFPAADYLLYCRTGNEVVALFTSEGSRRQYLNDIVNEIEMTANSAKNSWANYATEFTKATGTDIGSSVSMLVNDIAFETEKCRRERVGNSLGYAGFISSGVVNPNVLECYYGKHSKKLLLRNLSELKKLYEGGNETGFDDYLQYMNADYNGEPLSSAISSQFDLCTQKVEAIPVDFGAALTTNKPDMESLFLELKKLTVMLKVDMSSQLGVVINYSDNDGD